MEFNRIIVENKKRKMSLFASLWLWRANTGQLHKVCLSKGYLVPRICHGAGYLVIKLWCIWHLVFSNWYLVTGTWYLVSGICLTWPGTWHRRRWRRAGGGRTGWGHRWRCTPAARLQEGIQNITRSFYLMLHVPSLLTWNDDTETLFCASFLEN